MHPAYNPLFEVAHHQCKDPSVKEIFARLLTRETQFEALRTAFLAQVRKARTRREGASPKLDKPTEAMLSSFDTDFVLMRSDFAQSIAHLTDAQFLQLALSHVKGMLQQEQDMLRFVHADEKPLALDLVAFQSQTLALLEDFLKTQGP
jgi:hypothetical protein